MSKISRRIIVLLSLCGAFWCLERSSWAAPPPPTIALAPIQNENDGHSGDPVDPDAASHPGDGIPDSVSAVATLEEMEAFDRAHPDQPITVKPIFVRGVGWLRKDAAQAETLQSSATGTNGAALPKGLSHAPTPTDLLAPPLGASFIGMTDNGTTIPPDTTGAVGPNHVFEFLNTGRTIYNKNGTIAFGFVGFQAFWSSLGTGAGQPANSLSDPRVLWDHYSNRWLVSALGFGTNKWVLVGVSQTADPGGAYNLYAIKVNVTTCGFAHGVHLMDFDNMGFDPNNVIITGNIFNNAGTTFIHSDVYIINKARLLAGPPGQTLVCNTDYKIVHSPCPTFGANINFAPSITYGQTSGTAVNYVIDNGWYDTVDLTLRFFRVAVITGVGATATYDCLGDAGFVITQGCYNFNQLGASQPGGCPAINTNDYRISSPPIVRNGKIWFAHSAGAAVPGCPDPASNPAATKAEVFWVEQDPANIVLPGLPDQQGRVSDPAQAYYFPSLSVNKDDCVMIGFSGSGPNAGQFAAGYYTARQAGDPANTMQAVSLLKAGEATYYKTFGSGRNRWGDYSATCVDPADDSTLWTVQEYARPQVGGSCPTADTGRWGTWWGSMACPAQPPPPPCGLCGPGPHWIDVPPCAAGSDVFPSGAEVGIDTNLDCLVDTNLVLSGPALVHRTNPLDDSNRFPGTRPVDGHLDVIDTEMVAMTLTGGGVTLTAGAGRGTIPLASSRGNIAEQTTDPTLGDSFFDVFFEVDLGGGVRGYNQTALRVSSTINCIPPWQDYIHPTGCIPLYTSPVVGQGTLIANLVSAKHDPYPYGACCYPDGSCATTGSATVCAQTGGVYQGDSSSCSPNPCPPPCSCLGDINGDRLLDGLDIGAFLDCLFTGSTPGGNCACADMDHSGATDLGDVQGLVTALLFKNCGP